MNNEPVAWIDKSKLDDWLHGDCYPDQCFIHYQANDAIPLYTHPVEEQDESFDRTASHMAGEYVSYKAELTDEDRSMLIRTLKWAEDLLREAGHDEAVSDVQDCLMILRKA